MSQIDVFLFYLANLRDFTFEVSDSELLNQISEAAQRLIKEKEISTDESYSTTKRKSLN